MMTINRKKSNGIFSKSILQIILIMWAFIQIGPFLWLFYSSFKTSVDIKTNPLGFPKSFYLGNYDFPLFRETSGIDISIYFKNSLIVTLISLIILTAVSLLAGYATAKIRFPGKNIFIFFLIALLGIPVHSLIIPLYYLIGKMGLLSNYFGLVFPYVAFNFAFSTLLAQTYFRQFPDEIIDAAKIDGCGQLRLFFSVVMPISLGAVATILVINYINIWNEFLFSLVIMRNNVAKTLPVGLMSFRGERTVDWGPMFAVISISILPSVLFYLIFSRNLIKGMTAGAIKG